MLGYKRSVVMFRIRTEYVVNVAFRRKEEVKAKMQRLVQRSMVRAAGVRYSSTAAAADHKGRNGYVSQVIGAVVDVYFGDGVPPVLTALAVDDARTLQSDLFGVFRINQRRTVLHVEGLKLETWCF